MITAPTAPGRRFINRIGDILIEEHPAPAITDLIHENDFRIITLTNRKTGAQIEIDELMFDFMIDQVNPPAQQIAKRLQARLTAYPLPEGSVTVKVDTAFIGEAVFKVEAIITTPTGSNVDALMTVSIDKANEPIWISLIVDPVAPAGA